MLNVKLIMVGIAALSVSACDPAMNELCENPTSSKTLAIAETIGEQHASLLANYPDSVVFKNTFTRYLSEKSDSLNCSFMVSGIMKAENAFGVVGSIGFTKVVKFSKGGLEYHVQ